eukprot:3099178-Amphidinium_carterae.1
MHSSVSWTLPQHTASVFSFVVSLCDGIGCAFVALRLWALDLRVFQLSLMLRFGRMCAVNGHTSPHGVTLPRYSQRCCCNSFARPVALAFWKGYPIGRYRQNFASMVDRRFCVVTFVHPDTKQRVYHQLYGLPFGLGVVVNQFCRALGIVVGALLR